MNTPFNQPNLASYVRDGADAKLNKITFSDGTTQSTAGVTENSDANLNAITFADGTTQSTAGITENSDASFNTLSVDKIKISENELSTENQNYPLLIHSSGTGGIGNPDSYQAKITYQTNGSTGLIFAHNNNWTGGRIGFKTGSNLWDTELARRYNGVFYLTNNGLIYVSSTSFQGNRNYLATSDNRIKHNETELINPLDDIMKLKPLKYFKTSKLYPPNTDFSLNTDGKPIDSSGNEIECVVEQGFIAQSVADISGLSFLVDKNLKNNTDTNDDLMPWSLDYNGIMVSSVGAIQELNNKINLLEARLAALENQ